VFKTGDKLVCVCVTVGGIFEHGVIYECASCNYDNLVVIDGFYEFGYFRASRFILATELMKALV
jgi:hypothetical protein